MNVGEIKVFSYDMVYTANSMATPYIFDESTGSLQVDLTKGEIDQTMKIIGVYGSN